MRSEHVRKIAHSTIPPMKSLVKQEELLMLLNSAMSTGRRAAGGSAREARPGAVAAWRSGDRCLFTEHHFHFKEYLKNYAIHTWAFIWQTFSEKWMREACNFKETNWKHLMPMIKFELLSEIRILEKSYSLPILIAFQYLNDFSEKTGGDINKCEFLILYREVF